VTMEKRTEKDYSAILRRKQGISFSNPDRMEQKHKSNADPPSMLYVVTLKRRMFCQHRLCKDRIERPQQACRHCHDIPFYPLPAKKTSPFVTRIYTPMNPINNGKQSLLADTFHSRRENCLEDLRRAGPY